MGAKAAATTMRAMIRVTLLGDSGRADLAVPPWLDLAAVADSYEHLVGGGDAPRLATVAGVLLDPTRTVAEVGLEDGDLLVALSVRAGAEAPTGASEPARGPVGSQPAPGGPARALAPAMAMTVAAASALGAGCLVAQTSRPPALASLLLLVLLLAAVSAVLVPRAAPRARAAAAIACPAFAAGAALAVAGSGRGAAVLAVVVASLAAVAVAALVRAVAGTSGDDLDDILAVWLVAAGTIAVLAGLVLAAGGSFPSLLALAYGAAVVVARLLPYAVVDVPDQALLDVDRLAVTAWSVRQTPRSGRRRLAVRPAGVRVLVRRGHRMLAAGTVAVGVVASGSGPLLVLSASSGPAGVARLVLVGLGSCALALIARSFRPGLPRSVLRGSAVIVVAFLAVALLAGADPASAWLTFAGCAVVGVLVALAAVALGRGWRSVWWARMADVGEALGVAVVVAAVPVACGLFDAVRQLTS